MMTTETETIHKHPYHIVDVRPWPFCGATGALFLLSGLTGILHHFDSRLIVLGFFLILSTIAQWGRDVCRESTFQGKHTRKVEDGLRIGIILFIISEGCLFFSFFWAFFHSSLSPSVEIGSTWPPASVTPLDPYSVPLLNTTLLLSRGATVTGAHIAILRRSLIEGTIRLSLTVLIGGLFTILQAAEYVYCPFTMSDSIFGSAFFLATGFHGLHVIIGSLFLRVMLYRHMMRHFSASHHFGFESRAGYGHFVDVVWLFLFICLYWGGC